MIDFRPSPWPSPGGRGNRDCPLRVGGCWLSQCSRGCFKLALIGGGAGDAEGEVDGVGHFVEVFAGHDVEIGALDAEVGGGDHEQIAFLIAAEVLAQLVFQVFHFHRNGHFLGNPVQGEGSGHVRRGFVAVGLDVLSSLASKVISGYLVASSQRGPRMMVVCIPLGTVREEVATTIFPRVAPGFAGQT